jgi:gamma-tubulin complex component 2
MRMERMTLQKLWFFIQPSLHTLVLLGNICDECEGRTGGSLLNALHQINDQGGDTKTNELMAYVLGKASAPYMEMLRRWIFEGVLDDPYKEFMIAEEENTTKENVTEDFISAYWDKRYSLRDGQVVSFLTRLAEKVLTTGKYLNVVRECDRDVRCPDADVLAWDGFGADGSGMCSFFILSIKFVCVCVQ